MLTVPDPESDLPADVDHRTGHLMSVAELRAALAMVRGGLNPNAAPAAAQAPGPATSPPGRAAREILASGVGLPSVVVDATEAAGFVVGASGGSGESLLAELLTSKAWPEPETVKRKRVFVTTGHHWPLAGEPVRVALCARTNVASLRAAQQATAQWATGPLVARVDLVGLVLMADAPGREPKPIVQFVQVLAGGVPRLWRIPWIDDWRLGPPDPTSLPRAVSTVLADILCALSATSTNPA